MADQDSGAAWLAQFGPDEPPPGKPKDVAPAREGSKEVPVISNKEPQHFKLKLIFREGRRRVDPANC